MNLISQRLASRSRTRQADLCVKAEAAANAVDRAIGSVWAAILRDLRAGRLHNLSDRFRSLLPIARGTVDDSLHRIAVWGYRQSVQALTGTLSTRYLRVAAMRRMTESRLLERESPDRDSGVIQLDALGLADLAGALREPVSDFSAEDQKDIFADLLFPPPSKETLDRVINQPVQGVTWRDRLEGATRTSATPEKLMAILSQGFSQNKSPREIAKDLLPAVDGVRSSARRIARTESMRVSHGVAEESWKGMGDLVIGFQVHATLDQNTRPWHAARNGQVHFKEPKGSQLGMDQCPHPPLEADGSMAWNCFLPGQYVQGNIQKVLKARYAGQVLEIRCAHGSVSLVTANQPVFTKNGFVFARHLKQGDYLWSHHVSEQALGGEYKNQAPTLIENVAMSGQSVRLRKRATSFDFYGDGEFIKSEIGVIIPDTRMLHRHNSSVIERTPAINMHLPKAVIDRLCVNAEVASAFKVCETFIDLQFLESFLINPDSFLSLITSVRSFHYDGPVYDVETDTGLFLLGNSKGTMTLQKQCRCHLSPVLSPDPAIEEDPAVAAVFSNAEDKLISDPIAYSEWFAHADERTQRLAVGTRRYDAVLDRLGHTPGWEQFISPDTGELLPLSTLKTQGRNQREKRLEKTRRMLARRREMIRKVQVFGFLRH
jgi:hypothetical protein